MDWDEMIPATEITEKVTNVTVDFATRFGMFLGTTENINGNNRNALTTSQLRKFFGEVKRQQMQGYNETDFVLLKPKLAYAVGRDKKNTKIKEFYYVLSDAMRHVNSEKEFKNFIKVFEAIVAYHKAAEENIEILN